MWPHYTFLKKKGIHLSSSLGFWSYDAKIKMNLEDKSLSDYINQKVPMRGLYEMHLELKFKDSPVRGKSLMKGGSLKGDHLGALLASLNKFLTPKMIANFLFF